MAKIYRVIQLKLNQFKKMSTWSPTQTKHISALLQWRTFLLEFLPPRRQQKSTGIDTELLLRHCHPMYTLSTVHCPLTSCRHTAITSPPLWHQSPRPREQQRDTKRPQTWLQKLTTRTKRNQDNFNTIDIVQSNWAADVMPRWLRLNYTTAGTNTA